LRESPLRFWLEEKRNETFQKEQKPRPPTEADKMRSDLDDRLSSTDERLKDVLERLKKAGAQVCKPKLKVV